MSMLRRRKRQAEPQSRKPEDSDFKQQRLRAWEPLLTPFWVIVTFLSFGLLFLIIGVVTLDASNQAVQVEKEYKLGAPLCPWDPTAPQPPSCCNITRSDDANCQHNVTLHISKTMNPPVYVYYKLTNFYQNHRRYVKSRSDGQLSGESNPDVGSCDPLQRYGDKVLYPCGLIANSRFNDSFEPAIIRRQGGNEVTLDPNAGEWTSRGIAWKSDMEHKFKTRPMTPGETNVGPNGPLPDPGDETLAVWMRTAGLPTFKKLHRIIHRHSLLPGDSLVVPVTDTFQVHGFDGTKSVVISTTTWLGGKNTVLSSAYLTVGIVCFVLGIVFLGLHVFHRRDLGDMKYWNWRS